MVEEVDSELIEFYGIECVHCREMEPMIERLEIETKLKIRRLEIWHNEANASLMREYDRGYCGGVPFFFNKKTGQWLCGAQNYETLKKWALGE
jgi:thiol-disulfide isomerase/thioredoxin